MPTKTTEEWIAILQPKDVFCERVNNYTDYLEHPHVAETGAVDWIEQLYAEQVTGVPAEDIRATAREYAAERHAAMDLADQIGLDDQRRAGRVSACPKRAGEPVQAGGTAGSPG